MNTSITGVFYRDLEQIRIHIPKPSASSPNLPSRIIQPEKFILFQQSISTTTSSFEQNHLSVVAFGRIDNIQELLDKLNLRSYNKSKSCLAEIVARAYLKWEQDCPVHFVGDFIFAVWDSKSRRLFCARDQAGVKPFYYAFINHSFFFSSSLQNILGIRNIPKDINDTRVFDYISSVCLDNTSTFYKYVFRLPPAHSLLISRDTHKLTQYWQYTFTGELLLSDDNQYEEAFKEIFTEAVRCRINSDKLAILLSGGLDSTSVACTAEKIVNADKGTPLHVYSGIFNTHIQCDEQNFISETLQSGNFQWQSLVVDKLDPLESLYEIATVQNEPWFAPNIYMSWNLLKLMRANGMDLLLDGHDGDATISSGFGSFIEFIDSSSMFKFFKELHLSKKTLSRSERLGLLKLLYKKRFQGFLPQRLIENLFSKKSARRADRSVQNFSFNHYLHRSFLEQPEIRERIQSTQVIKTPYQFERDIHFKRLFDPVQPIALEVLARTADAFSIEYRFPFWDKRLLEFCLSLPASQIFKNGYSRSILRRSMKDVIPSKIQWRPDKTDFLPSVIKLADLVENDSENNPLLQSRETVSRWIDIDKFLNHHKKQKNKPKVFFAVWKVLSLHAWMATRKERNSRSDFLGDE